MYELERLVRPVLGLLGEGGTPVLGGDADVAQLLNMSPLRQPTHHALSPHLLQSTEVDVPESIMPPPDIIAMMCGEADRSRDLQSQHI
jgi:hypothetical protein